MNIIGDIAGEYDALMALLKKMPDDEPVSLGDMCDRGPKSKEVFDFFMNNGRAILGNHDHMCLDFIDTHLKEKRKGYYDRGIWFANGGGYTWRQIAENPMPYYQWLKSLPYYTDEGEYFLSHAPINPSIPLEKLCDLGDHIMERGESKVIFWNRGRPRRMEGKIQIYGHNARKNVHEDRDKEGVFAYGVDTSRAKKLTGYSTLTKEFYEQEYL